MFCNYKLNRILGVCLVILFLSVLSLAQSAGSTTSGITGFIRDEQDAAIGGATISVKNLATNLVREFVSNDDGEISILQLPPGDYEIIIKASGFMDTIGRCNLEVGKNTVFSANLSLGTETIEVEISSNPVLDMTKTESSTNINRDLINNLPINRRSFLDFSLTSPRVTVDRLPQQGVAATSGLSFNSQSARLNSLTLDGLENTDNSIGSVRSTISQEAVQEFQIVSDNYNAEFGRAIAGIVNVVTKAGTNSFQGRIFNLIRNDETSARDVFASVEPSYKQYQFGGILSGPVKKDKSFFFGSFERLSVKQNNIVTLRDASIAAARRQGFQVNNGAVPFGVGITSFLGRLDSRLSANNNMFLRYNFTGQFNGAFEPFGGLIADTSAATLRFKENTVAVSNTYVNDNLKFINETRFLYNNINQRVLATDNSPQVRITAPEGSISFGRTRFIPQRRDVNTFQFVNNVTLIRGSHQIKFGADIEYLERDGDLPFFSAGTATFTPLSLTTVTGIPNLPILSGFQAFDPASRTPEQRAALTMLSSVFPRIFAGFPANLPLADLSLPRSYTQGFGNPTVGTVTKLFSFFIQDNIKLSKNFLLKTGLRYDNNRVTFIPSTKGNFSPRIALSYKPNRLPLTVRASYGIFFGVVSVGITSSSRLLSAGDIKLPVITFPFAIVPYALPGHQFPESFQLPAGVRFVPQLSSTAQIQSDLRNGYSQQANLGISFLLAKNEVSINYNFLRGIKILGPRNINPIVRPIPSSTVQSALLGRPDPTKGNITEFESAFDSYYNGVTVSIGRKFANNITGLASYTFSKSIDNTIDIRTDLLEVVDPLKIKDERGLSLQDVRQRFVLSGNWDLNYSKNKLLSDFQISSIITLESGRPYNLLAGVDLNLNGDNPLGDRPAGLGRNVGITPGFATVDLRLTKTLKVKEQVQIQGFIEAFNLFNRVNISEIDRTFPPDATGRFNLPAKENGRFIAPRERFRNAFSPRQLQIGVKFNF